MDRKPLISQIERLKTAGNLYLCAYAANPTSNHRITYCRSIVWLYGNPRTTDRAQCHHVSLVESPFHLFKSVILCQGINSPQADVPRHVHTIYGHWLPGGWSLVVLLWLNQRVKCINSPHLPFIYLPIYRIYRTVGSQSKNQRIRIDGWCTCDSWHGAYRATP